MRTEREATRIVRSWLEEGVTALPDRVLDDVLDRLPATHQRRATWWPARRLTDMNKAMAFAIAAAAVVVVAILGISFFSPGDADVGGPGETPGPTPTPGAVQQLPASGDLEPGTYRVAGAYTPRSFTLTVPSGWSTEDGWVTKGSSENLTERDVFLTPWIVSHVFADSCLRGSDEEGLVEARTVEEIVDRLTEQGGHETNGPTTSSVGGFPAQVLEFRAPNAADLASCDGGLLRLWPGAGPDLDSGQLMVGGQIATIYVVDIDGQILVLMTASRDGATENDVAELERIVESIEFTQLNP